MARYRLLNTDGDDLGPFTAATALWEGGERIQRGHGEELQVVRVVPAEPGDDVDGYLVVGPVG